jgi:hypothetical protein
VAGAVPDFHRLPKLRLRAAKSSFRVAERNSLEVVKNSTLVGQFLQGFTWVSVKLSSAYFCADIQIRGLRPLEERESNV